MITYRIRDTIDAEERLEDAAMFKALYDALGGAIEAVREGEATFGAQSGPHAIELRYFEDPAFLVNCGRRFDVCLFDDVKAAVDRLHDDGLGAFIKTALQKFFITQVPLGASLCGALGDMAWSFIDSPVPLMVQELVDFTFEHRFFCIDRKVVAWSPAAYTLTPLDFPTYAGSAWRKQSDRHAVPFPRCTRLAMHSLAELVAATMREPTATIDIGMIGDTPAVVELNPFRVGQVGLFAADVRAIAKAAIASLP